MTLPLLLVLTLALVLVTVQTHSFAAHHDRFTIKPTPDEIQKKLTEGNKRFYSGQANGPYTHPERLVLAGTEDQGDHAYATVIACSDSRVPVELIFDAGIMDIFVVRVAGNVFDTNEIGSIEYGLAHVHTPLLVVLGHTQCGAVTAVMRAMQGQESRLELNIKPLIDNIVPSVEKTMARLPYVRGDDIIPHVIEENVWHGIETLFARSPAIRNLVREGKTKVIGAIYDVGTGEVEWLDPGRVDVILDMVEASPHKETEMYAEA